MFRIKKDNSIYPFIPKILIKINNKYALDEKIREANEQGVVNYFKDVENL